MKNRISPLVLKFLLKALFICLAVAILGASITTTVNAVCTTTCGNFGCNNPPCPPASYSTWVSGTVCAEKCLEGSCPDGFGTFCTTSCQSDAEAKAACGVGVSDPLAGQGCSIDSVDSVQHRTRIDWAVGIESGTTISSINNAGTTYGVCGQPVGTGSRPCGVGLTGGNCASYTVGGTDASRTGTCYLSVTVNTSAGDKTCRKGVAVTCTMTASNVEIGYPSNNAQRIALNSLNTGDVCNTAQFSSIQYAKHDESGDELSIPTGVDVICVKTINSAGKNPHVLDYMGPGTAFHIRNQDAQQNVGYAFRIRTLLTSFPTSVHQIRSYVGGNFDDGYCGGTDYTPSRFRAAAITCPPTVTANGTVTNAPQQVQICERLTTNTNPPTNCVNTTGVGPNRSYSLVVSTNATHRLFAENLTNYSRSYTPGRNFAVQCNNLTGPTITYNLTSTTPTGTFTEAACAPNPVFSGTACDADNPDTDGDPDTSGSVTVRFYADGGNTAGGSTVASLPGLCGGEFNKAYSWNPTGWNSTATGVNIMDGNPHTIVARAVNAPTGSVPTEVQIGSRTFTNTRSQSTCHFQGANTCGQQFRTVSYACGNPANSEQITDCPNLSCPPVFIRTIGGDVTARTGSITSPSPLGNSPLSINSSGGITDAGVVMAGLTVTSPDGFSELGNNPGVVAQNYTYSGNNTIFAPVWLAGILDNVAKNLGYSGYTTANFSGPGAPCASSSGAVVAQRFRVWCTSASRSIDAVLTDIRNSSADPTGVGTFFHIIIPDPGASSGINQTITAKDFSTVVKNVLIVANNSTPLTLTGNITTQTSGTNRSTLLFLVNNGVDIQGNVTRADGAYIFNGTFDSDSTDNSTAALTIRGQVLAMNGGFDLKRIVSGNPGETFTYDPRYLVLFDDLLMRPSYTSRELTPN